MNTKSYKIINTLIFVLFYIAIYSQNYISTDLLSVVKHLKYKSESGTSFIIIEDSENYLVTAKHLFKGVKNGEFVKFEIELDNQWKNAYGTVYYDTLSSADIVLIKTRNIKNVNSPISIKPMLTLLGDEGYFIGFPYGNKSSDPSQVLDGFPVPLVKKAVFSGGTIVNNSIISFLDGHNNPGFSGGPVLFTDRAIGGDNQLHLIGVISAYINQDNEVNTDFGKFKYFENSGIIISYGVKHIHEIIKQIEAP